MTETVLLWYDAYHTPLGLLSGVLDEVVVLDVELGGSRRPAQPADTRPDSRWPCVQIDGREEWCERYLLAAVNAHAIYQGGYVLSSALARPLQAELCVRQARASGARRIVHGLAGNDQLRFEMAVCALAPELEITSVAQLIGSQTSRNGEGYTVSDNLWGRSTEAGPLADPAVAPPVEVYRRCRAPQEVSRQPSTLSLGFEAGRPVSLDGRTYSLSALIAELDDLAAEYGIGAVDCVEDGFVGLKSRAVYEAPAAHVLITAHRDLQRLVSSRRQGRMTDLVNAAWTDLVYDGCWFDPARASLEAYLAEVNSRVTGAVQVLLHAGGVSPLARQSNAALYDESAAIYRVGQDISSPIAAMSAVMRAALDRSEPERSKRERSEPEEAMRR